MSYLKTLSSQVAEPGFKPRESGSRALCSALPPGKTRGRANASESSGDNLVGKHSTAADKHAHRPSFYPTPRVWFTGYNLQSQPSGPRRRTAARILRGDSELEERDGRRKAEEGDRPRAQAWDPRNSAGAVKMRFSPGEGSLWYVGA